jgi:hypothetical protein
VIVIEWAERMGRYPLPPGAWRISISGDGDAPRKISIAPYHAGDSRDAT